jgi:hypothetical protein
VVARRKSRRFTRFSSQQRARGASRIGGDPRQRRSCHQTRTDRYSQDIDRRIDNSRVGTMPPYPFCWQARDALMAPVTNPAHSMSAGAFCQHGELPSVWVEGSPAWPTWKR